MLNIRLRYMLPCSGTALMLLLYGYYQAWTG
jgi:hypothetical protein